jgi:hypothetical protein
MNEKDKKILTHELAKIICEDNLISLAIVVKVGLKILKDNDSLELVKAELPD